MTGTFEESVTRLETIIAQLDAGRLDLENSLARYEEGIGLIRHCHELLEKAQQKIEIFRGCDETGKPQAEIVPATQFQTDSIGTNTP